MKKLPFVIGAFLIVAVPLTAQVPKVVIAEDATATT
jgi:hypothetical protein